MMLMRHSDADVTSYLQDHDDGTHCTGCDAIHSEADVTSFIQDHDDGPQCSGCDVIRVGPR